MDVERREQGGGGCQGEEGRCQLWHALEPGGADEQRGEGECGSVRDGRGNTDDEQNPQIGKNLYLHPTNFVSGIFEEDVQPWEGTMPISVVSSSY